MEFSVDYGEIAHSWFVQPFYYPEVAAAFEPGNVTRTDAGNAVTIQFKPK